MGIGSWELDGVDRFDTAAEAVSAVLHTLA
jgi:hypothetical protein